MVQYVITLANSVVGVSVLALPFCFQQCGIVLATLMLICSAILTRVVCHFLLKGGTISRRRTYELLAYHTHGPTGKLLAELTIIGFLLGTLIAFMVVMGDLGPQIVSEILEIDNNNSLRTIVMTGLALFVALPLGLLRNIDSLGSVSIITLMFYMVLVCKILASGVGPLWAGTCLNDLNYWRPAGILQCIPIFAMALSCQTQIFPIYDSLPEPTLSKMNSIVKNAVYLCTFFYFCVGFFGYVAFCSESVEGNILVNFKSTASTQFIKCCFVFSIAFSVPLVILPCRASLHSMIWREGLTYHHLHEPSSNYIPEGRLRLLTVLIIGTTLIIGLMIPNIELVLGLVGSTAGSIICIIFPALMFISVTPKNTTEKLVARIILVLGIVILVMTTYATLYAVEKASVEDGQSPPLPLVKDISPNSLLEAQGAGDVDVKVDNLPKIEPVVKEKEAEPPPPPRPVEPQEPIVKEKEKEKPAEEQQQQRESENVKIENSPPKEPDPEPEAEPEKKPEQNFVETRDQQKQQEDSKKIDQGDMEPKKVIQQEQNPAPVPWPVEDTNVQPIPPAQPPVPVLEQIPDQGKPVQVPVQPQAPESVHEVPVPGPAPVPVVAKSNQTQSSSQKAADGAVAEQLIKQIEKQQEEQRKLIEEQKQVLAELKKHHEEHDQAEAEGEVPVQVSQEAAAAPPVPIQSQDANKVNQERQQKEAEEIRRVQNGAPVQKQQPQAQKPEAKVARAPEEKPQLRLAPNKTQDTKEKPKTKTAEVKEHEKANIVDL